VSTVSEMVWDAISMAAASHLTCLWAAGGAFEQLVCLGGG
jgi:hypothetical protein